MFLVFLVLVEDDAQRCRCHSNWLRRGLRPGGTAFLRSCFGRCVLHDICISAAARASVLWMYCSFFSLSAKLIVVIGLMCLVFMSHARQLPIPSGGCTAISHFSLISRAFFLGHLKGCATAANPRAGSGCPNLCGLPSLNGYYKNTV